MKGSLLRSEVAPFLAAFTSLVVVTLVIDAALHLLGAVWVGRYLGIAGTALILGSFVYSLRKRKLISAGKPITLLRLHERLAWVGSMLLLVHAGIHFNAILAWLAVGAMLLNVGSGLTGKFLLERARKRLKGTRERLETEGLTPEEQEDRLYWDSLTFEAVKRWRVVHFPITIAFASLALGHVVAVLLFWRWP